MIELISLCRPMVCVEK